MFSDEIQIGKNRIIPYPPSFNNTAARIIEPSKGASTCALGNHKWVIYIGILIRKANIIKIDIYTFIKIICIIKKDIFILNKIIVNKRGSEAVTV